MTRALIGILVVSVSCTFAGASQPPAETKTMSPSAVSAKRQAKIDAIHAKRKAASQRKRNAVTHRQSSPTSLEALNPKSDAKATPHRADATISKQVAADNLQLQQQQSILPGGEQIWNQERQALLMELSAQGIALSPNGVMLPSTGLPTLQVPSFGGLQIPSFGGIQVPAFGGLQIPAFSGLQIPSFGGLQVPTFGGLPGRH
jgi:hypothetical protein